MNSDCLVLPEHPPPGRNRARLAVTAVTASRVPLGLAFVWALTSGAPAWGAIFVAGLAALSDFIDGRLARRLRVASPRGAWLDVWADAWFVECGLTALAWAGRLPWATPVAMAIALSSFAYAGMSTPVSVSSEQPARGRRSGADRLGHVAGIVNWGIALAGAVDRASGAGGSWLHSAGYAAALVNLAPVLTRLLVRHPREQGSRGRSQAGT